MSLSARRAWIEILTDDVSTGGKIVALRKESVDRNRRHEDGSLRLDTSLSARRAWIEMNVSRATIAGLEVALRKESVDRNLWWGVRKAVGSLVALRKESVDRNCFTGMI